MPEIKLKPCPFCGQEKYIVVLAEGHCDNRQYQIVCDASGEGGCGASCGWQDTLKEAKEAWNRRACGTKELHAYWVPSEYGCKCSMCQKEFLAEDAAKLYECPNCKSQMGEPRKEADDA